MASESILWWKHELINVQIKNKEEYLIETVMSNLQWHKQGSQVQNSMQTGSPDTRAPGSPGQTKGTISEKIVENIIGLDVNTEDTGWGFWTVQSGMKYQLTVIISIVYSQPGEAVWFEIVPNEEREYYFDICSLNMRYNYDCMMT